MLGRTHQAAALQELPVSYCLEASRALWWVPLEPHNRGAIVDTIGTGDPLASSPSLSLLAQGLSGQLTYHSQASM